MRRLVVPLLLMLASVSGGCLDLDDGEEPFTELTFTIETTDDCNGAWELWIAVPEDDDQEGVTHTLVNDLVAKHPDYLRLENGEDELDHIQYMVLDGWCDVSLSWKVKNEEAYEHHHWWSGRWVYPKDDGHGEEREISVRLSGEAPSEVKVTFEIGGQDGDSLCWSSNDGVKEAVVTTSTERLTLGETVYKVCE